MGRTFAIIGGGIAGACVADHLARATETEDKIVLFEQGDPAAETTRKSVAQFGYYGDSLQHAMKQYGMAYYNDVLNETGEPIPYQYAGLLSIARNDSDGARLAALADREDGGAGKIVGSGWDRDFVRYLAPEEIYQELFVPPLNTNEITGAVYRPRMGYFTDPQALSLSVLQRAKAAGVETRRNTRVEEIRTKQGRVTEVVADERLPVDAVVCAAGPWNPAVAAKIGLDIPVNHTLAPVLQLEPPEPIPYSMPAITLFNDPHAIHRRRANRCLIGYNPPEGYRRDERFDPDEVPDIVPTRIRDGMWDAARSVTPYIADGTLIDEWVGVRSQTPDGNPIVGWTAVEGFSILAFNTSGIQLAPAAASVISRELVENDPTEWYDGLSITRFNGYRDAVST